MTLKDSPISRLPITPQAMQFLHEIHAKKDIKVVLEYVHNCIALSHRYILCSPDMSGLSIGCSYTWSDTVEGHDYWSEIANDMCSF